MAEAPARPGLRRSRACHDACRQRRADAALAHRLRRRLRLPAQLLHHREHHPHGAGGRRPRPGGGARRPCRDRAGPDRDPLRDHRKAPYPGRRRPRHRHRGDRRQQPHRAPARSRGGAGLRRLRGQPGDAEPLSGSAKPVHPPGRARRLLQPGRRHPHGAGDRRGPLRRLRQLPRPTGRPALGPARAGGAQLPLRHPGEPRGPSLRRRGAGDRGRELRGRVAAHDGADRGHRLRHRRCPARRRAQLAEVGPHRPAAGAGGDARRAGPRARHRR